MELNAINNSVSRALGVINMLENQTAQNITRLSGGISQIQRTDFREVMKLLISTDNKSEPGKDITIENAIDLKSEKIIASETQIPDEVLTSQRLTGKYELITEIYSKQLTLYRLAIGGKY